ncbi:methyltransferase domain-containing protein [Pseudemcibacter aquimaris]|uniref:methyltransferase domain-containing protein n=1 Tax=Pseudemcibacter aquimaris TaxID=2857064 RepID=UPI002012F2E8|nr:methyltransferase domain-containing protein [Pseudemcibacter aquimaris]MCC3861806.1 methyltransferase domain-containing protein [Pseudemcibacter aquimaris]WDU58561.1 methyltransferase domain-containing protein [Pseudemcibacter aquimaris]
MTEETDDKKTLFKPAAQEAQIFNRGLLKLRRDQAAKNFDNHDFLNREITLRQLDNLDDIKREFKLVLNMGGHQEPMQSYFKDSTVLNTDLSDKMLNKSPFHNIQADEEFIPVKPGCLDLVFSILNLHSINDLPGTLIQILHSLKPDGLFVGAAFGGETLHELRASMMKADMDALGGIRPHVSPFMDVRDAGGLLQRAGFALPVVSTERITVNYDNAFKLMKELKGMAENNILAKTFKGLTKPSLMMKVAEHYQNDFADINGRIPATFDILYFKGWAPHESQQKPLKPGSAKMSLTDALGKFPPKEPS